MQFISTRGGMEPVGFTDVLLTGLAPDGGLAVPASLPILSGADLEDLRPLPYAELAARVIGLYATDIPEPDLLTLTRAAYGQGRFPEPVVPVTGLDQVTDGLILVGLSEGPTMAFKDLAMQFLGQAIPYVLRRQDRVLNILGATSGDTGSAAEHAFKGQDGVSVFMLSPAGRMSAVQRAQMYSIADVNIHNIAVQGVFDDCQNLVKAINADQAFKSTYAIGAVNSINFGRIAAQIVYYVWAWLRVTDELPAAERSAYRVDVTVPSGNFGNVYAGHLAREMGLPLRRLIVATNENNVLDEFFRTGVYAPRASKDTLATSSPSMDISRASNLERFLWTLLGPDAFAQAWRRLEEDGRVDLSKHVAAMRERYGFVSASSSHKDRLTAIRVVHATAGRLIDPHTADGVTVALSLMQPGFPTLALETAKAAKFGETVAEALGAAPEPDDVLRALLEAEQHVETIGHNVDALRALIEQDALVPEKV
ncbi:MULTISPECIES: threonine synthase [Actinomyces]|uniref:Threonine synthase n=1 Tax=Actinomyces respiraculi TaxID=2744574 RepID=A0A7T0LL32_9ACTO|nr:MULTISPECIES: threonine synthase [Actinomyces]QPL05426.1 threonine synthase [Actinomyces respiraculi]